MAKMPAWAAWAMLCAVFVVLMASLFLLAGWVHSYNLGDEISLPLLAIAGVVALLGALALVAIAFALMNMSDKTEALGLPSGSVRAVIALSLVILFAILSVFLFSSLRSDGKVQVLACLGTQERDQFLRNLPSAQVVLTQESNAGADGEPCPNAAKNASAPVDTALQNANSGNHGRESPLAKQQPASADARSSGTPGGAPPQPAPGAATGNAGTLHTVWYRDLPNRASEDFAKQLLVLIGTLVTSVAGFYFGAKAVADAQNAQGGLGASPSLSGVTPSSLPRGSGPVSLQITGSNMNSVNTAQIAQGSQQVSDTAVVSNSSQVQAKFDIPASAPTGAWDVLVTDMAGRVTRLPGVLAVTERAGTPTPAGAPKQADKQTPAEAEKAADTPTPAGAPKPAGPA